jgi:acyl dehydratase
MAARVIAYADLPSLAGQELGVSEWLTITQERVDQFADATGDDNWIHVDVERAKAEIGGTIAHGFLTLSLLPFLSNKIKTVTGMTHALNYGVNKVRFTQPVPVGAHIRLRLGIKNVEDGDSGRRVTFGYIVEMEGSDKPVCVAETVTIFFPA